MRFGFNGSCLEHDPGVRHPENPDRLRAIREALDGDDGVEYVDAESATVDAASRVHTDGYLQEIQAFIEAGGGNWDPDTIATETTWEAALASAGLAIWAAETALDAGGGHEIPFSLGRPPGHHATEDDAMGFCFLNNSAIAAAHALETRSLDRVAILDWDVHHGNGTQDIFYERGDVYYVSLHEHGLYPGTGDVTELGDGAGEGTTLNIPLPPGSDDADYLAAMDELVRPGIVEFDPDLLLVSAGFDAHLHDPISRMHVTTPGYRLLAERTEAIAEAVEAGLGFVLEGGYGLDTLAEGVGAVNDVFEGASESDPQDRVSDEVVDLIQDVRRAHQAVG
jgi:acetoin utilization deacetylase AcuC-like enzyme